MVLMAQPFSYRYPLVNGQGNWGSTDDPKSFAAMRYTESKLTAYAASLLSELGQGTVDWVPNFDGTLREPQVLPARLAECAPEWNDRHCRRNVDGHSTAQHERARRRARSAAGQAEVHAGGPDETYPRAGFPNRWRAGIAGRATSRRSIRPATELCACARAGASKMVRVVVTNAAIPDLGRESAQEQIAAQMRAKKLPWVDDLRDESDHEEPIRLVISPRSRKVRHRCTDVAPVRNDVTGAHASRVNLNIVALDGRPRFFDLRSLLVEWLDVPAPDRHPATGVSAAEGQRASAHTRRLVDRVSEH